MAGLGDLDRLVALQSVTQSTDSDGFPTESFSTQASVWARRRFLRGDERWLSDASQRTAQVQVEYRMRHRTDINPLWLVNDAGELWDITAVMDGEDRNRWTDLHCTRHDPRDE